MRKEQICAAPSLGPVRLQSCGARFCIWSGSLRVLYYHLSSCLSVHSAFEAVGNAKDARLSNSEMQFPESNKARKSEKEKE